ncbi:hypothetical protein BDD12DRAFT_342604 [Trichophaea hybrida]|nr:hypothetical protein BDD12DRAFT_342604 [Trichophaea hybrida]
MVYIPGLRSLSLRHYYSKIEQDIRRRALSVLPTGWRAVYISMIRNINHPVEKHHVRHPPDSMQVLALPMQPMKELDPEEYGSRHRIEDSHHHCNPEFPRRSAPTSSSSSRCQALGLLVCTSSQNFVVQVRMPIIVCHSLERINIHLLVQCILIILEQVFTEYLKRYCPNLLVAVLDEGVFNI